MAQEVPLESAAGVPVEVDDAGEILAGTVVGLIVTALKDESLLVQDLDIFSFYFNGVPLEDLATWEIDRYLGLEPCILLGAVELLPSKAARSLPSSQLLKKYTMGLFKSGHLSPLFNSQHLH